MAKLDPAIRRAITPVAFDENKLHRERLVDALHAEIERKLIVLAAPAGYGKTTLLSDFSAHTELPVCWLRVSDADMDYLRFAEEIIATLKRRFRRLDGHISIDNLRSASCEEVANTISNTIAEQVTEAFVLIIDDANFLDESVQSRTLLDELIQSAPDQMTFLLAGRTVNELSLARLMADGQLSGFGPSELALTREEVVELSRLSGVRPANDIIVTDLLAQTQGWIAGILLSSAFARHRMRVPTLDDHELVYDYLASATLNRLPTGLREFLLESSIPPLLTPSLCDAVLERTDSEQMLLEIATSGLFVTWTDDDPRTYEYHPLFREFLKDTLRASSPSRFWKLIERVAEYLDSAGDFESAVTLFLEAGELDRAQSIMNEKASVAGSRGWLGLLTQWENRLRESGRESPALGIEIAKCAIERGDFSTALDRLTGLSITNDLSREIDRKLGLCFVLTNLGEDDRARAFLLESEELIQRLDPDSGSTQYFAQVERYKALLLARDDSDLENAVDHARTAVELLRSDARDGLELAYAYHTYTAMLGRLGRYREASASELKAYKILEVIGSPIQLSTSLNNLGVLSHQNGEYEQAIDYFSRALTEARRGGSELTQTFVVLSQADLFNDLGLVRAAGELYEIGLQNALSIGHEELIRHACTMIAVLHRRRTSKSVAISWLQRALEVTGDGGASLMFQVQQAALEASSSWEIAKGRLQSILDPKGGSSLAPRIELAWAGVLLSQAYLAREQIESATSQMRRVLALASRAECYQPIASELLADRDLYAFCESRFRGVPAFEMIESRLVRMQVAARNITGPTLKERSDDTWLGIDALGGGRIRISGERVQDLLKPQARELLYYLADKGHADKEDLSEVFWPSHPPGRQTANLHMAIYSLRSVLGKDAVLLEGVSYKLSRERKVAYDVAEFERAADVASRLPQGDPRRLFAVTEALRLYRGAFLPEFDSDWVVEKRRMVELRYLDLVAAHAEETLMRNEPRRALERLREGLEIDPLRDDLNARYLEALGQMQQRSEVVRHYNKYVSVLSAELGLEPSESIREIYLRLIG